MQEGLYTICACDSRAGVQTLITSTKNSAVQCSLLPAPPLSFLSNSPEQLPANDDRNSDLDTAIDLDTENKAESDTDYCESDNHLERYSHCAEFLAHFHTIYLQHECTPSFPSQQEIYIVFEECLLPLFRKSRNCGDETTNTTTII